MTLDPILSANPVIQIHFAAALFAIVLGPAALYLRHGSVLHRVVGYSWVIAMALLALSSFGIHGVALIGPFSPLHGLAVLTLWSLWEGIRRARAGQIALHRRVFRNLYWFCVIVAGLFNFLPGRAINRVFLSEVPELGYAVIVFGLALAGAILLRQRPARTRLHDRADHAL